jgi:peptidoglycan/LPS O-acetylase OafA/YrhL
MLLWNIGYNIIDFLMPMAFMFVLYLMLSKNCISIFFNKFKFELCGKISYMMFLIHHLIATLFDRYNVLRGTDWKLVSLVYLIMVIVVAIILKKIICILVGFEKNNKFKEQSI